jgi:putative membrane protein insertion efficiency factor
MEGMVCSYKQVVCYNKIITMTNKPQKFMVGGDTFDLEVNEIDSIIVQRHFLKRTKRDSRIQKLQIPSRPVWLNFTIQMIRIYQRHVSQRLGNRCVFDPSCSHYSELAFRKHGFYKGLSLTIKRLKKCKAENGGVDELI